MDLGLKGKNAVISGGTHGIGRSIALSLANEGCNVCVFSRDKKKVNDMSNKIKGVKKLCFEADVLNKNLLNKTIDEIVGNWGTIDIVINNVGGGGRWGKENIEETSERVWQEVYDKNVTSARILTMRAIPYMRKNKWGRVITIASILGKEGGGKPWFNMAKSSQISLMKTLAMTPYLVRDGITFNTVAPGAIMIPETGWEEEKNKNSLLFRKKNEELPLGRMGTTDEVANIVVFLCSELSSLVNGSCITVDGGESRSF